MAKASKARKAKADAVHAKKSTLNKSADKMNPFEVHVNKEKFHILGRTCKHDKGMPGVSRAKAVRKRKETLGREFREKDKTNHFKDHRIGKHMGNAETEEELLTARFVAEKLSQFKQKKVSRFNLNDDETLTHRGQTLEEIEEFCDERSEDDDDDEVMNANITETVNFGGNDFEHKDRQTAIEDIIIETKKRKAEIAKNKDEIFDLTTKLDKSYKDLMPLIGKTTKSNGNIKPVIDDYDKIVREMVFEPRGVVSDKLLSQDEIAQKERARLELLEKERLDRMRDDDATKNTIKETTHRSADDLDDGYFAADADDEEPILAYNMKGEAINIGGQLNGNCNQKDNEEEDENIICDKESESEEENEKDDVRDTETSEEEESEEDDDLSDLKASDSEPEDKGEMGTTTTKTIAKPKTALSLESCDPNLPFTIEMPNSYDELRQLLSKYQSEVQAIIVERIIKCNHPTLNGVNREAIVKLFTYLLQYINDLFHEATTEDISNSFKVLDKLSPYLFDLINLNPEKMSFCLLDVIKEKYNAFKTNTKSFPSLETLVFFKLVSNLFSTSDYRHNIVTPCYIFIQHILSKARIQSRQDVAMGLFLVTITIEFSQQSKRFLPSALNFLLGIVYLSIPKRPIEVFKILPPFVSSGYQNKLLTISEKCTMEPGTHTYLTSNDLVSTTLSIDFKVRALNTALHLIREAVIIVGDNVGSQYIAEDFLEMLKRLVLDLYPDFVAKSCEETVKVVEAVANKPFTKLIPPERKPKALRLFEPHIEKVYDDKRRPKMTAAKEERAKLLHKVKRETKGAIREIRRDTQFLQKIKIDQMIQSDLERKEKVKRIYQEASLQQGELNELARAKKRKKF